MRERTDCEPDGRRKGKLFEGSGRDDKGEIFYDRGFVEAKKREG